MNLDERDANSTIRVSFDNRMTYDDIDYAVKIIVECVKQLRSIFEGDEHNG